jgi:hypothetical protein
VMDRTVFTTVHEAPVSAGTRQSREAVVTGSPRGWAKNPFVQIRAMHLLDQRADVNCDRRATETGLRGTPAPMPGERAAMPTDDDGGLHDLYGAPPAAPNS